LSPFSVRKMCAAAAVAASLCYPAAAEDIDLFTSPAPGSGTEPNILIVLDNSANWSRADQQWPIGKQGESELRAIYTLLGDAGVGTNINLGLMMLNTGSPDGGYIRYHIRNMTDANKAAFRELIGTASCVDGPNSLNKTPNCILKNYDTPSEKTNAASTRYSAALFEVFKYFGGYTEPALAYLDKPGSPVDPTHFGNQPYGFLDPKADPEAYTNASKKFYSSPLDAAGVSSCGKNYVIFIGNGYPQQDNDPALLTGIGGNATVPPPIGNRANRAANWAKYLWTTDVNEALGKQSVATYTIDVFNAKPDPNNQTALLKAMAKYGGGRYFEAKSEEAIVSALRQIIVEIQSVNSVFASASLPINATNRSQNENQVFIGMFRPDRGAGPRWLGNLKQFQVALFGNDARLADRNGNEAVAASTGFIQACSTSFWTSDSGSYWSFSDEAQGACTAIPGSQFSDLPDGGVVEKGGAAEVLRRGNNPSASEPFTVNRTMYTCSTSCGSLTPFNDSTVSSTRTGAATSDEHKEIIAFTRGFDLNNENEAAGDTSKTDPRASIHGDIAHSRPLPVNYGGTKGVVVYYGANDGTFKAVEGNTGRELWSFIAPEHHSKLKRLYKNTPLVSYPNIFAPGAERKDYFFDGSSGLYQNADDTKVWIFPTMRRGGRMIYAFDVTSTTPVLKWARGCPNMGNDLGCTPGFESIGQTWSGANVAFIKGYSNGDDPVIIMGGGYDNCLEVDSPTTTCTTSSKGNRVYVIKANDGTLIKSFTTDAPVAADATLIDRDFDGKVDHAYIASALGTIYRVDFMDPASKAALASGSWTINKVAYSNTGARKFLFGPAALVIGEKVYLGLGSGNRERPLKENYPYTTPVLNRFYSFIDSFTDAAYDLNGATMENFTAATNCDTTVSAGKNGWFMDLNAGVGEQTVTSSVIFGGAVFFSTNRPLDTSQPGSCGANLGEARGYAVNLLNASGVIGSGGLCGGSRSGTFAGGGIPPSPVVGTVPVDVPGGGKKPINVLIGGIDLQTGGGAAIAAQQPPVPIKQIRSRVYWYPHGDR
jgi:type IV pilus assembly protein PilY1